MTEARPEGQRTSRLSGFVTLLIATGIAGVASYALTILVPNRIGLAGYSVFAVFWSAIYLVVGALGGIQQEVTRATHPLAAGALAPASRARNFATVAGASVFVVVLATAPLWSHTVFPSEGWSLVWPLAVGTSGFVVVAVLGGTLYGVGAWTALALMISVDALLRLAAISIALVFTTDVVPLAWAVAVPFPLAIAVLWPTLRRSIAGKSQLDVGYRALTWNVSRTVVAATATGLMVSGFPLILGLTSHAEPAGTLGVYIATITLTRAPLIVVALSLQSYLVVSFRDNAERFWRRFLILITTVFACGGVLAAFGWFLGPTFYHLLFRNGNPDGPYFAVLVISSALVAMLCISAAAVLARSQHVVYSIGWVISAVVTIAVLLLPIDFSGRTKMALIVGPLVGLAVHGGYLVSARFRERRLSA